MKLSRRKSTVGQLPETRECGDAPRRAAVSGQEIALRARGATSEVGKRWRPMSEEQRSDRARDSAGRLGYMKDSG
jgi:hypothetical protein